MVDSNSTQRIADYFVVVGLGEDKTIVEEADSSTIKEPITDISVIVHSYGEKPPPGYEAITRTPAGFPADLNSSKHPRPPPTMYICYKRGSDKPPIVDISIHSPNRVLPSRSDYVTLAKTGQTANISDSSNTDLYITYKTATSNSLSHNTLVVVDIQVINESKGEVQPHLYYKIRNSTNVGKLGNKMHICYKKTSLCKNYVTCNPQILYRFPPVDYPDSPLLGKHIEKFCLPTGAVVEEWNSPVPPITDGQSSVCTFVLTDQNVRLTYGTALIFYEEIPREELTDKIREQLNMNEEKEEAMFKKAYTNKCICILSKWPFFKCFEAFLKFLHRKSTITDSLPLERYLSHFLLKVPFPSIERPKVHVYLNHHEDPILISRPAHGQLPVYGASFTDFFWYFDDMDSFIELFMFVLLEEKLLIHSLLPSICVSIAECIISLLFPLQWQSYYNPLCPLSYAETLMAPMGVIAGIDSRYFELYDPPDELHCYDVDSRQVRYGTARFPITLNTLPKKILNTLRKRLEIESEKMNTLCKTDLGVRKSEEFDKAIKDGTIYAMRRQSIETGVQDAFLQFMASILKGYRAYLKPIKAAPSKESMDIHNIFDIAGFIKSKGTNCQQFYKMFCETMMFRQFICERSFISSQDQLLAFFDVCVDKVVDVGKIIQLLDYNEDPVSCERQSTLVVQPPEQCDQDRPRPDHYSYSRFPTKNIDPKFYCKITEDPGIRTPKLSPNAAKRTAPEKILSNQKLEQVASIPNKWANLLLAHVLTIWFIHLPSYVKSHHNKAKVLNIAFEVLCNIPRVYDIELPDEVCYRVLIQLCGQFAHPALAVKVFDEMKKQKITPNAVTYGYYHKAVLEGTWPSTTCAAKRWMIIRHFFGALYYMKDGARKRREEAENKLSADSQPYEEASLIDFEDNHEERQSFISEFASSLKLTKQAKPRDRTISDMSMDSGGDSIEMSSINDVRERYQERTISGMSDLSSVGSSEHVFVGSYETSSSACDTESLCTPTEFYPEVAIECVMTSCFRCCGCSRFLYDENIMSGWSPDDSNYTTVCCYCDLKQLASLTTVVKDCRGCYCRDSGSGRSSSQSSLGSSWEFNPPRENKELYGSTSSLTSTSNVKSMSNSLEDVSVKKLIPTYGSSFSPPSSFPIPMKSLRQARHSFSAPSSSQASPSNSQRGSPKFGHGFGSFRTRSNLGGYNRIADPEERDTVIVHYLSPLVLRKSLENLIEKEGDSCLQSETVVTDSAHIFWNMIWYFKRFSLPSHLPDLLQMVYPPDPSYTPEDNKPYSWETETLITTGWDCERSVDEPLPPYVIWCAPLDNDSSPNKEAVLTPRSVLQTIVNHMKQDDFATAVTMLAEERKRQKRYNDNVRWTVYRELMFLYLISMGRNIHAIETFEKEYSKVYKKLSKEPYTQLSREDKLLSTKSQCIRRIFGSPMLYIKIPPYLLSKPSNPDEGLDLM